MNLTSNKFTFQIKINALILAFCLSFCSNTLLSQNLQNGKISGLNKTEFDNLKSKNDSLIKKLALKEVEIEKMHEQSNVQIKNSIIKELTSKYTKSAYDIYISYPKNYEKSGKKYPLLVVLDAEVNFGAITYISERLIKDDLIPELFIVGIAYKGETDESTYYSLRSKDFTPTSDIPQQQRNIDHFKYGAGGAENFVNFLSLELFPYLTKNFPIKNEDKSIYGHSFGGLFGFHVLLNHPTLFENYLLLSPSLWWNKRNILRVVKMIPSISSKQLKLYVGTGSLEGNMVDEHLEMVNKLKQLNTENLKIKSEILDNETHRSIFGRGFTNGLRYLYTQKNDSN